MFAATTDDALCVADPYIVKKAPASIPECLDLIEVPTSTSWTPDNTYLYIASAHAIHRYDPVSVSLREVYVDGTEDEVLHIVARDTYSIVFSKGSKVCVLECEKSASVTRIFEVHKSTVNSLSLSNDNTLLLSTSKYAAHVHDLSQNQHIALRGLSNLDVATAMFHPHHRTRLLVAGTRQLAVYDTTRPSSSLKTISVSDLDSGIAHVACSPFSKALAAVASATGSIALLDLEKDRSLVRIISLKAPLTVIAFSPDGGSIYAGTSTGTLLMQDLRALDTPKATVLSSSGAPVRTFSIQKRLRDNGTKTPVTAGVSRKTSTTADAPLPLSRRPTLSKTASSPARSKASIPESPTYRRTMSSASSVSPTKRAAPKVLSPIRDPHRNSAELEAAKTSPRKVSSAVKPISRAKSAVEVTEKENPRKARTLPSTTMTATTTSRKASGTGTSGSATATIPASTSTRDSLVVKTSPKRRPRALSSVSTAGLNRPPSSLSVKEPASATATAMASASASAAPVAGSSRPSSAASRVNVRSAREGSASPVRSRRGTASTVGSSRPGSVATSRTTTTTRTCTPSPDLHEEPATPVPVRTTTTTTKKNLKAASMNVLGLGTPEVERWAQMGDPDHLNLNPDVRSARDVKGKGKMVGFQEDIDEADGGYNDAFDGLRPSGAGAPRERVVSLDISPRKSKPGPVPAPLPPPLSAAPRSTSGSSTESWTSPAVFAAAPNGFPASGAVSSGPVSSGPVSATETSHSHSPAPAHPPSAQDLLRTIVQDVMFDFQRETKAEMMGLHLDLLRMGRGWKAELRTLMDEYVGDLRELREENQRLRVENERLRRGG